MIELIENIANHYLINWFPYGNLVESVSLDFFCPFLAFHGRYHALTRRAREIGLVSHKQHNRWYLSAFSRMRYQKPRSRIVECISCVFISLWTIIYDTRNLFFFYLNKMCVNRSHTSDEKSRRSWHDLLPSKRELSRRPIVISAQQR